MSNYNQLLWGILILCNLICGMEQPFEWLRTVEEASLFKGLIIAYKLRLDVGDSPGYQLNSDANFNYGYISLEAHSSNCDKEKYLLLYALTTQKFPTRIISDKTLKVAPLKMRLADSIETEKILQVMAQNKKSFMEGRTEKLKFEFNRHADDKKDTDFVLSRLDYDDLVNFLNRSHS